MKMPPLFRDLYREARRQGWSVHVTNGGHLCWQSPEGRKVFSGHSPSDKRSLENHRAAMKRCGFTVRG